MAQAVADIPLDGASRSGTDLRAPFSSSPAVINPSALRVEVMDPHDLWDARDAGLRGAVEALAPAMIEAAAPVVTQAVLTQAAVTQVATRQAEVTPAVARRTVDAPVEPALPRTTLQLGAFASPAAAERAWSRIADAGQGLAGLSPVFEPVEVDGRSLTRLKVSAPAEDAVIVCRAADSVRLGCLRRS